MSNYTKSTNFATKDNLTPGDPLKIVRGTEIDTEFNNIATAIATKTDNASAAITGGAINDTTIGATTASTGAFTTLAASGNVTLSGGTANGVAYLNGSKVVTSGSALTFDGTNLGVTGNTSTTVQASSRNDNGTTNAGAKLATLYTSTEITSLGHYWDGSQFLGKVNFLSDLLFTRNNSEQMRLTSTGLGIGTSSPAYKLDVKGGTGNTGFARISTVDAANGGAGLILQGAVSGQKNWVIAGQYNVNGGLEFTQTTTAGGSTISSTPAMTLDASGRLGIGQTSPAAVLDVKGSIGSADAVAYITDTSGTGASSYPCISFRDTGGQRGLVGMLGNNLHINALPASSAILFKTVNTEVARIDSSGNLGLGVTPKAWRSGASAFQSGGYLAAWTQANGSVNLSFAAYEGSGNVFNYSTTGDSPTMYSQLSGAHKWYNAPSGTAGNAISFSQAMTLDSSGNLLVGTTSSTGERIQVIGTSGSGTMSVQVGANGNNGIGFRNASGTSAGSITVNASTVAYNTSSDYRLKNTIAPMTGALAKVAQLKPVTYKWNVDGSDGEGFIAHELAEVCPHAVTGEKDGTCIEKYEISPAVAATYDEDGNELTPAIEAVIGEREVPQYQGIDTSFLVATLTAAIQELKAEFDAYKASHP